MKSYYCTQCKKMHVILSSRIVGCCTGRSTSLPPHFPTVLMNGTSRLLSQLENNIDRNIVGKMVPPKWNAMYFLVRFIDTPIDTCASQSYPFVSFSLVAVWENLIFAKRRASRWVVDIVVAIIKSRAEVCQSNIAHPSSNRMQITVKNIIWAKSNVYVKTIARILLLELKQYSSLSYRILSGIRGIFPQSTHNEQ